MIRILICDNREMLRDGYGSTVQGIQLVGKAQDGAQVGELVEKYKPSIILIGSWD